MEETKITEMVRAATDEVFRTMLGMEAEPGESYTDLGPLGLSIPTVIYGRNYRALSGGTGSGWWYLSKSKGAGWRSRFAGFKVRSPMGRERDLPGHYIRIREYWLNSGRRTAD